MKTYLLDIIPKIKRFSQKLDDLTILTNQHWVVIDEETDEKVVFIFREKDNQLLISGNGKIEKGTWEYLGNNSILIDRKDGSFLFKHGFIDDYILALKIAGKDDYALLVNESKFEDNINSISSILDFLQNKYLNHNNKTFVIPKPKDNHPKDPQPQTSQKQVIPKDNNDRTDLIFSFKSEFSESEYILHKHKNKWGYIDKKDNVVIDFKFDDAYPFSEGLAAITIENKRGYINSKGDIVIQCQYDSCSFFKNGVAEVSQNNSIFFIDKKGNKK